MWARWAAAITLLAGCGNTAENADDRQGGGGPAGGARLSLSERGARLDAIVMSCTSSILHGTRLDESLSAALLAFPHLEAVEACMLEAKTCDEALRCEWRDRPAVGRPMCTRSYCDGNVARDCTLLNDSGKLVSREVAYDCAKLGGVCVEGTTNDEDWVECDIWPGLCEGRESRCEGSRAVVCNFDLTRDRTLAGVYDCADAFGAACSLSESGWVECQGDAVRNAPTENSCQDGLDDDSDGATDCADPICQSDIACTP